MSTTPSGVSVPPLRSGYVEVSPVFDIVLTAAERALFEADARMAGCAGSPSAEGGSPR